MVFPSGFIARMEFWAGTVSEPGRIIVSARCTMVSLLDYRDHVGASDEKFYKTTLVQSDRLMLGLNCLEPGQEQSLHAVGVQNSIRVT